MTDERYRIVLVEDNPYDVLLLNAALEGAGLEYDLTEIADGAMALAYFRGQGAYNKAPPAELAIIDLNLPKCDGIHVLEALRKTERYGGLAVIVTSSSTSPQDRMRAEQLGLECFLSKPSDLDGFMEIGRVVKEVLGEVRARNATDEVAGRQGFEPR
ncbi:MAG: response regulator [Acidobacteria bacterium]|nr:response regulator [Acidobacteriota bacterium]